MPAPDSTSQTVLPQIAAKSAFRLKCGVIMPISGSAEYLESHWAEVLQLIKKAADKVEFDAAMVSENTGEDMIHASIVRNIYQNPVVVCDVSSLNANVMIEFGLRMATIKPLIVVFDGVAKYPFDITQFIRVQYDRSLPYFQAAAFVNELSQKIAQVSAAQAAGTYTPFLSHFQEVTVEALEFNDTAKNLTDALQSVTHEVALMRKEVIAAFDFQGKQMPTDAHCMLPTEQEKAVLEKVWLKSDVGMVRAMGGGPERFVLKYIVDQLYGQEPEAVQEIKRVSLAPYIPYFCSLKRRQERIARGDKNIELWLPEWPYF